MDKNDLTDDIQQIYDMDQIDDKIYLDEELSEIEYYEILSFDELISDNSAFILLSKKEIYNELYDFFYNANKSNNYVELFYNIVEKKNINTNNYILKTNSTKKSYQENDSKKIPEFGLVEFINSFKKINKYKDLELAKKEKDKLFFTIIYDENSTLVRFKPYHNTNIIIKDLNFSNFSSQYVLLKNDDTNIPIEEIYYSVPKCITNDYLSDKVLSYLKKNIDLNSNITTSTNINEELNNSKPSIQTIIDNLDLKELYELEELDYNIISILFEKFDYQFDKINTDDYNILLTYITNIINNLKVEKYNYKSIRNKIVNLVNHKILFYDKIINIFKLLLFSEDIKNENDYIIDKLEDEKNLIDTSELLYNNIYDIVYAFYNNDIDNTIIIDNIKNIMNKQILEQVIYTIKNYNNNDIENINNLFIIEKNKFDVLKNFDIKLYQNPFIFNIDQEINEIKIANDYSDYFISNTKNNDYIDIVDRDDDLEDDYDNLNLDKYNKSIYEKYIYSFKYQDAHGFNEYLKIIYPIIGKIEERSKLNVDFNLLYNELYKLYGGLSTKFFILKNKNIFDDSISDKIIEDISNINYKIILKDITNIKSQISYFTFKNIDKIIDAVIELNNEFMTNIKDIFFNAIAIWILEIQNSILDGTHLHNYNYNHAYLWSDNGYPINKNKRIGVTVYLCDIINSLFQEIDEFNIYNINIKIIDTITNIIDKNYKDLLNKLITKSLDNKFININKNKGKNFQINLVDNINTFKREKTTLIKDKMLHNYVNALIYMPGINYNRIHKFLLGCCLQQINKDFAPDNDMKGKRNDLLAAKQFFSKNRYNNKPREYFYLPEINDKKDKKNKEDDKDKDRDKEKDDEDDPYIDSNDFINISHNIYNYEEDILNYDKWLNSFKDNDNKLFSDINYKNIYSNGSNEYIKIIKNYLYILIKTINNQKSTIINDFINNIEFINFKQLINNSMKIISKSYYEDINENDVILEKSISDIKYIIYEYNKLDNIYNKDDKTNILRTKAYLSIKAICIPFNPDFAIGDKMQLLIDVDDTKKYYDILKNIHNTSVKILNISKIPTFQENQEFINKMREEFKNKKLDIFDKQTDDQRKIFNELTKIGIRVENLENIDNDDYDVNEDAKSFNGEDDYHMNGNNDDQNPDDLDNEDHGHIYD